MSAYLVLHSDYPKEFTLTFLEAVNVLAVAFLLKGPTTTLDANLHKANRNNSELIASGDYTPVSDLTIAYTAATATKPAYLDCSFQIQVAAGASPDFETYGYPSVKIFLEPDFLVDGLWEDPKMVAPIEWRADRRVHFKISVPENRINTWSPIYGYVAVFLDGQDRITLDDQVQTCFLATSFPPQPVVVGPQPGTTVPITLSPALIASTDAKTSLLPFVDTIYLNADSVDWGNRDFNAPRFFELPQRYTPVLGQPWENLETDPVSRSGKEATFHARPKEGKGFFMALCREFVKASDGRPYLYRSGVIRNLR